MDTPVSLLPALPQTGGGLEAAEREDRRADPLARMLDRAPLLAITLTPTGTLSFVNRAVEEALGYQALELVGRCWCQLLAEPSPTPPDLWREELRGVELRMATKRGEPRLIAWDFQHELDGRGRVIALIGWGRDLTAQRREEQAREALIQQQQHELAARAELLAIAAYELKTPLTLLIGRSQLLQAHLHRARPTGSQEQRDLDFVVATGLKLNTMVEMLFSILRVEEGQVQMTCVAVDLHALLVGLLQSLRGLLQQHQVELTPSPDPLVVLGEPRLLAQLFEQLLENAVRFSPPGSLIRLDLQRRGQLARVQVVDQGRGMPRAALPGLFQPASQAALPDPYAPYKMKGGLYIVREVVTLHQGTLDVTSAPGQGTTFSVSLPLGRS